VAKEGVKNKAKLQATYVLDKEWDSWMSDDPRNPHSMKAKEMKEE
jgi:hypothetical protein